MVETFDARIEFVKALVALPFAIVVGYVAPLLVHFTVEKIRRRGQTSGTMSPTRVMVTRPSIIPTYSVNIWSRPWQERKAFAERMLGPCFFLCFLVFAASFFMSRYLPADSYRFCIALLYVILIASFAVSYSFLTSVSYSLFNVIICIISVPAFAGIFLLFIPVVFSAMFLVLGRFPLENAFRLQDSLIALIIR